MYIDVIESGDRLFKFPYLVCYFRTSSFGCLLFRIHPNELFMKYEDSD